MTKTLPRMGYVHLTEHGGMFSLTGVNYPGGPQRDWVPVWFWPDEDPAYPPMPQPAQPAVIANAKNTRSVARGQELGGFEKSPDLYTREQMRAYADATVALRNQLKETK